MTISGLGPHGERAAPPERVTLLPEDKAAAKARAFRVAVVLHTLESADGQRLTREVQPGEEQELMVGDPVTGLLDAARAWGADLIVVGTHAQGAIEHFFVGSTAEKIVARSPIPVLTVRAGQ